MKRTFDSVIKWIATIFLTISAVQVSLFVDWALLWWSFLGFLIGHIIWTIFAYRMREWSLLALNAGFIILDIYAILVRI